MMRVPEQVLLSHMRLPHSKAPELSVEFGCAGHFFLLEATAGLATLVRRLGLCMEYFPA
jgi:hypothetical protein